MTEMTVDEFGFDLEQSAIDTSIAPEEARVSYQGIVWHSRSVDHDIKKTGGFWTIDVESTEVPPLFFLSDEIQFGSNPNSPLVSVYRGQRLRVALLGVRGRIIIIDDADNEHYYPEMTPKDKRVPGKYKSHKQLMVMVATEGGPVGPFVIGLKGYAKTVSWTNPPEGHKGHQDKFPTGVWEQLSEYTARANSQRGLTLTPFCTWWFDLVPATSGNKPYFADLNGTHMNPFTVDMRTGGEDNRFPATRFVGKDLFAEFQELRRDIALPWEKDPQWRRTATPDDDDESGGNGHSTSANPVPPEDEDIPF